MLTTRSIHLNTLRSAVEQYVESHPEGAQLETIPSHIGSDFRSYGFAQSDDHEAISEIERIARQIEEAAQDRDTAPFAPRHQCQVEPDGDILFA